MNNEVVINIARSELGAMMLQNLAVSYTLLGYILKQKSKQENISLDDLWKESASKISEYYKEFQDHFIKEEEESK